MLGKSRISPPSYTFLSPISSAASRSAFAAFLSAPWLFRLIAPVLRLDRETSDLGAVPQGVLEFRNCLPAVSEIVFRFPRIFVISVVLPFSQVGSFSVAESSAKNFLDFEFLIVIYGGRGRFLLFSIREQVFVVPVKGFEQSHVEP